MQLQQFLFLTAVFASTVTANPLSLNERQVEDTCDARRLTCGSAPGANQSLCAVQKNACDACEAAYEAYITSPGSNKSYAAAFRAQCFTESAIGTGDGVGPLISSLSGATTGFPATTSTSASSTVTLSAPSATATADTCDARRLACGSAPGANQSLCAVQKNACDACEVAYEAYITSPGSNKSYAAAFRAQCFTESAIGTGDGVGPLISSLSGATTGFPATKSTSASSTVTLPAPVATATADTCDARRLACGSAPGANQSLCAVQKNACDACESAYEAYVTSPGSNKSYAAAFRAQCFTESAIGTGDGVVPLIASLSAAGTTTSSTSSTIHLSTAPASSTTTYLSTPSAASSTRYLNTSSEATATTSTVLVSTSTPSAVNGQVVPPTTGNAAGNSTATLVGFTTSTSSSNPTSGKAGPQPTSPPVFTGAASVVRPAAFGLFVIGVAALL